MIAWTASRVISILLLVVIAFIGLDALFHALNANPDNVIVGFVGAVAAVFLWPFADMFPEQQYLLTALIAVLGWSLLAALVAAILGTFARPGTGRFRREVRDPGARPGAPGPPRDSAPGPQRDEPTRRL